MKGAVKALEAVSAKAVSAEDEGEPKKGAVFYATQDAGIGDSGSERTDHDAERR
jgi:hypothetical protein